MPGEVMIVDGPVMPWVKGREAYDAMEPCSLIAVPAGLDGPAIAAGDGARLLVKVSAAEAGR